MFSEQGKIKESPFGEGILYVGIKIYGQQAAGIIRTQRNFSARIGRNGTVSFIRIAIGYTLADDGVPEEDSRFCRFPGIMHDLIPQLFGIDVLGIFRIVGIHRIFLQIFLFIDHRPHELVINFYRYVGSGHFPFCHFCINETFGIRVIDGNAQHQGSAPSVLGYLPGGIGITFHERYDTGGSQRRIFHRRAFGTDMG